MHSIQRLNCELFSNYVLFLSSNLSKYLDAKPNVSYTPKRRSEYIHYILFTPHLE